MDFSSFIAGSDFSDGDDPYQPKYVLISSPKTFSLQDFVTACVCARACVCVCVCVWGGGGGGCSEKQCSICN